MAAPNKLWVPDRRVAQTAQPAAAGLVQRLQDRFDLGAEQQIGMADDARSNLAGAIVAAGGDGRRTI
jgi:hypothetical protein